MTLIQLAIGLIILVTVIAIVSWLIRANKITIPEPVMYVLYAVLAIACILFLASFAGYGPYALTATR